MKITNLEVRNFRIFDDAALAFTAPVTMFIGPNHRGKTTLIDAIRYALTGFCPGTGLMVAAPTSW